MKEVFYMNNEVLLGLPRRLNNAGVPITLVMEVVALEKQLEQLKGIPKDTQSKLESRIEIFVNYVSGFIIAYLSWQVLAYGPMTWGWFDIYDSFIITSIFTVISMIRSYAWRRFFAVGLHKVVKKLVARWFK